MGFKIIILSSFFVLSLQQTNVNNINNQQSVSKTENINENDNAIVVEASTGKTKIVNNGIPNIFADANTCVCVPYYLCGNDNRVITDGAGVIDARAKMCNNPLDICCNEPLNPTGGSTVKPTNFPSTNNRGRGCGRRNNDGAGVRIKGDGNNVAEFGELPWMIAIIKVERVDENVAMNMYQCGGSLIHPRVVMTAAHCVVNRGTENLLVRAGEWDAKTENERFPHENQNVTQIIIHEDYYSGGLFNDIALLVTEKPFNLTDHIDTICIPPQGSTLDDITCTASGWGKDEFGRNGSYQAILKKVDLPLVQRDQCERQLRTTRLGQHFRLHNTFICAGGESGRDTCKGDGGGPLVCPVSGPRVPGNYETRYQQAGIVAWGISCGDDNIPGVYVNVACFKDWIDNHIRKLNFDPSYYTLQ